MLAFLLIAFAVAAFGSLATLQNVDGWYASADKAFWTSAERRLRPGLDHALHADVGRGLAGLARARTRRAGARRALVAYVVQLVLNAIWTPVFFGLYPFIGVTALWIGLVIIVALDVAVLVTMLRFWPVRRLAAVLLIPYWAWVLYATTLNAALAVMNP